jgi:hypothetical protein
MPSRAKRSGKIPVADAYSAERVRGGEIILRTRWQRLVFVAGLGAAVVVMVVLWAVAT